MVVTHFGRTSMALAVMVLAATACGGRDGAADSAGSDTGAVQSAGGDVAASNMASPAMVMGFRATVDQGEIEAGQLAQGKATNAQVKQFAQMIVTDHRRAHAMADSASGMAGTAGTGTAATGAAGTGAAAAGGQPAADVMAMHQQAMTALRNAAKGRVFDSTYVALMIAGHQDVLSRVEGMRGSSGAVAGTGAGATGAGGAVSGTGGTAAGGQMELESWIETVRTHLTRAQELQRTIQGGGR